MTRYFNSGLYEDAFYTKHQLSLHNNWNVYENIEYDRHLLAEYHKDKLYDNEFVVVPREFVYMTVLFFEVTGSEYKDRLSNLQEMLKDLTAIKNYL
ncbi:hypothetical protein Megpolyxen_00935 [Candidatus Megaera polyxenophila]|nr:hypothetical protein Megpolyxen_00935 [Candidatus Megaera polyxenophila]